MRRAVIPFVVAAALIVIDQVPAFADDDEQATLGQSVADRQRPEYDAIGQRVGGFILYPSLYDLETYDSNINATSTNQRGDLVTSLQPTVDLKSDWNTNALNLHAGADWVDYAKYGNNNYTNYDFSADGRLDVYHDARLFANAGYSVLHLPWWSPNIIQGQGKPTEYSDTSVGLAGEKEFNHLSFRVDENFDYYNFSNVTVGGLTDEESKNNFGDERVNVHTGYEIVPGRQVYLLTGYDQRIYDSNSDLFGYNRNSTGYIAAVGAKYEVTGLTFLDAFVGYRQQDYADARLGTISGMAGGLKLTWNFTTLDTLTGNVTRDIDETIIAHATGYFATIESLNEDHELLRNLILTGHAEHETDDFSGITRTDEYYRASAGAKYLLTENFWLNGGYQYETRSSSAGGGTVDDNSVFIGINAHL